MRTLKHPCLLRDFIHDRLYCGDEGYFTKLSHQLGMLQRPLQYQNIEGVHSYMELLGTEYPSEAFLTPVEIFQPWYGHTIAQYMLANTHGPVHVLEIGAGTGTAALSILDFFYRHRKQAYAEVTYTLCEISPPIAQLASERLKQAHPQLWRDGQLRVFNASVMDWNSVIPNKCFVLGLEILDNMPHDRVWLDSNNQWTHQSVITETLDEEIVPINDQLIRDTLQIYLEMPSLTDLEREAEYQEGFVYNLLKWWRSGHEKSLFLPTGTYAMLQHLHTKLKKPHFIFSDFDALPSNKVKGIHAPIIAEKGEKAHESTDFPDFRVKRGEADIFFPTNFRLLNYMIKNVLGLHSVVYKSHKFMETYSQSNWTLTKTGYRPLKDDFRNTSFLVTISD